MVLPNLCARTNSPNAYSAIRVAVRLIRQELQKRTKKEKITVNDFCNYFKLKTVVLEKSIEGKGRLVCSNGTFYVYINKSLSGFDRNYVIAHEVCHYIILKAEGEIYPSNCSHDEIEKACNIGASELLIPLQDLKLELPTLSSVSVENLEKVRKKFKVSKFQLAIALNNLYPQISFQLWRRNNYVENFRLCKAVQRYSKSLQYPWLPLNCSDKHLSIFPDEIDGSFKKGSLIINNKRIECVIADWKDTGKHNKINSQLHLFSSSENSKLLLVIKRF